MQKVNRALTPGLILTATLLGGVLVCAQLDGGGPGREAVPPDIAQEWRLDNNERDTFGQAPLGELRVGRPWRRDRGLTRPV